MLSHLFRRTNVSTLRSFPIARVFSSALNRSDQFISRHIGPRDTHIQQMLNQVGFPSLDALVDSTVPAHIRLPSPIVLEEKRTEYEAISLLREIASKNKVYKSFIGMGYNETITPPVILRNMIENPGWYTAYTPYQAEISQGRLESLLNFQTMISDLTGLETTNASLLDEATAAAEAMSMSFSVSKKKRNNFFISQDCHPQTISVVQTRAEALGINVEVGDHRTVNFKTAELGGILLQYPNTYGTLEDLTNLVTEAHSNDCIVISATDLLALTLFKAPGEFDVDIVVGSAQRFGVPMGFGGPHAGFMSTKKQYARKMPGRIIGVARDVRGKRAYRMALQTREQHIRRDKATSNICTAQALLANVASAYGVYHGPEGLKQIADRIHALAVVTSNALKDAGFHVKEGQFFDTIVVDVSSKGFTSQDIHNAGVSREMNIRVINDSQVGISFGEPHSKADVEKLLECFGLTGVNVERLKYQKAQNSLLRTSPFMTHPVFNTHHSETMMLRFLKKLENKDLALNTSMISLGSCTMKLNAVSEMIPITWPEFSNIHPFAPVDQWEGYKEMIDDMNEDLARITGFAAVSSQPNSGAQGEYAGLLCIRKYLKTIGEGHRNVCLIPVSAHGTNPASAVMAGMQVITIKSDEKGNVDLNDLREKAQQHAEKLAAIMITYPSTFGVFESGIREIIDIVHSHGGQVYMDGANMNAQVGLTSPGFIGADVCHLNLHKTFCIPHGGGGPGVGSICVAEHLIPHLPANPVELQSTPETNSLGAVSAATYGSAMILPITWMYIKMLGSEGLKKATSVAILNANYMAKRLEAHYKIAFKGENGQCAHEFIIDLRPFKQYNVTEEDVAKRLQDFGFHSPTMSWPVPGTLMVEPTESEDKGELDRFCDALITIRQEIEDVVTGKVKAEEGPLRNAPHTLSEVTSDQWNRVYSREQAAFPVPWVRENKFWPSVGRIDNVYGDLNFFCTCPPVESYSEK